MSKLRVLVLGASGMLGHKLWEKLPKRFPDTWGTLRGSEDSYQKIPLLVSPSLIYGLDVLNIHDLKAALEKVRPDVIVNCIAVTKRNEGSKFNPHDTIKVIQINSELPYQIAEWANANNCRVIHFSTDCVFDGEAGGYLESDPPNAIDLYGRTKVLGELNENHGRCLTLRSSFIGREISHHTELLEWFLAQNGKTVTGYRKAVFSGLASWVLADLVGDIIERFPEMAGRFQVASEPINKYELLNIVKDVFSLSIEILPDDNLVMKRNLNGSNFQALTGFIAPSWREMVKGIANGN